MASLETRAWLDASRRVSRLATTCNRPDQAHRRDGGLAAENHYQGTLLTGIFLIQLIEDA